MGLFNTVRLKDVEAGRNNNLNLIRLVLASSVIFSHSYAALNFNHSYGPMDPMNEPMMRILRFGASAGDIAVFSFFFISGYLILKSALHRTDPPTFLSSRVLRIFPGLCVSILLSAFVIGPIFTTLPVSEYFRTTQTYHYLLTCFLNHGAGLGLPGLFKQNAIAEVNIPIWTLSSEWSMYMLTLLACLAFRWKTVTSKLSLSSWIALGVALLLTLQMLPLPLKFGYKWMLFFIVGSSVYLLRDYVLLSFSVALPAFLIDLALIRFVPILGKSAFPFALCYLILVLGFHPALHANWFHRFGDFSYGIYIFGWPIQQILAPHFTVPLHLSLASYPIILCVAMLSWYFVESPSLSLKKRTQSKRTTAPVPAAS